MSVCMLRPSGGVLQFVFHLRRLKSAQKPTKEPTNALGKLEIKWRNAMGEVRNACRMWCHRQHAVQVGRLQTQQIVGQSDARREVSVSMKHVPGQLSLGVPFEVRLQVRNNVDRRMGPLAVGLTPSGARWWPLHPTLFSKKAVLGGWLVFYRGSVATHCSSVFTKS